MYYHHDVLRDHLDLYLNVYEEELASSSSTSTVTNTTTSASLPSPSRAGIKTSPPSRRSNFSSLPKPSTSQPPRVPSQDAAEADVYTDASDASSRPDATAAPPANATCCYSAIYRVEQEPEKYNDAADNRWK